MWKKWIAGNAPQAQESMVKSMMIRRTKDQKSKVTSLKDFFQFL